MQRNQLALLLAISTSAAAASAQWNQIPSGPSPRRTAMAYDSAAQKTVLFSGHSTLSGWIGDTWIHDKNTGWSQVSTSQPGARRDHAMAFDSLRARTVLFGGQASFGFNFYADTWEFDGSTWTQLSPATAVQRRSDHSMVFDTARGVTVLFGGLGIGGTTLQDTWEFDGTDWTQRTSASGNTPSARMGHSMAYDSSRGVTLLFGGTTNSAGGNFDDTWEWDGASWTEVSTANAPTARDGHGMTFDSHNNRVLLFGGIANNIAFDDTWTFDAGSSEWLPVATATSPSPRYYLSLVFDSANACAVTFGGRIAGGNIGSTWSFDATAVTLAGTTAFGSGCGSPALELVARNQPVLGSVGRATIRNAPTAIGGVSIGFSNSFSFPVPLPFDLSNLGLTGCLLLQSNELFGLGVTPGDPGELNFATAIPPQASAIGSSIYLQGYCLAPGQNPAQVITSNGLTWTFGNY